MGAKNSFKQISLKVFKNEQKAIGLKIKELKSDKQKSFK